MKTVEITRHKEAAVGVQRSTFQVFMDIYRREGIRGINKGVNAVAVRQCTNWGSRFVTLARSIVSPTADYHCRMGFARLAETTIRNVRGKGENDKLGAMDKILASSIGGALATWNQPIEVVRVEVSLNTRITCSAKTFTRNRCNRWLRPLRMQTGRQN